VTDANGVAALTPSAAGLARALQIEVMASTGTATPLQYELSVLPLLSPATGASTGMARRRALGFARYASDADLAPSEDRKGHSRPMYRQDQP
jgi:hypothetical protein